MPGEVTFEQKTAAVVRDDVLAFAESVLDREWLAYDPSYSLSPGQAFADDLAEVPELERLQQVVTGGRARADAGGGPIVAMAHEVFAEPSRSIVAYRLKGPGIATRRPRGIRHAPAQGRDVRDDRGGDRHLRAAVRRAGDRGFGAGDRDDDAHRACSGSTTRLQRLARETFARATRELGIEGGEALAEAVATDPTMAAKMAQLARILDDDPDYASLLTTANLVDFLDRNPAVQIATTGTAAHADLCSSRPRAPATRS